MGREGFFCEKIVRAGLGKSTHVYTFNGAGLELQHHARKRGLKTVMEQTIAPRELLHRLLREEQETFPGWESPMPVDERAEEFEARERMEWAEADLILCGSEFVRECVAACGGPVERCAVVPYGVNARFSVPVREPHAGPLRVLTVGQVGLRKGAPYVLEAARRLHDRARFRMVGSLAVPASVTRKLGEFVELTGAVPRSEILRHYAWADVFLLPSICEGSATVTYEALCAGLPVICTPNTGSVVRDGMDGFVVPARDSDAIVERLETLASDRQRLRAMREAAQERGDIFLSAYASRLVFAVTGGRIRTMTSMTSTN